MITEGTTQQTDIWKLQAQLHTIRRHSSSSTPSSPMSSAHLLASHSPFADTVFPSSHPQQDSDQKNPDVRHPGDNQMNQAQTDHQHSRSDQTGNRETDHRQEADQLNNLSNGHPRDHATLSNGVPANDGSDEKTKPSSDTIANADSDSHHDCQHCHHVGDKVKEYIWIDSKPKEVSMETRPREDVIIRSIRPAPITIKRKPFLAKPDSKLRNAGTARAYMAATEEKPYGTTHRDWARNHSHQTVLQQHCDFFDTDHDGIIWPQDTFWGFHKLGFGIILSLVAVFIIHANFSYPTLPTWLPDPFFRVYIVNIHKDKHGSDSGTYDHEGRFVPQKFMDIFEKYADGRDYVTLWDVSNMMKGQRCIADPIGWGGAFFEWLATYLMLWPEDGRMMKEDIRGIYDGSLFYKIAARRASNKAYGYE